MGGTRCGSGATLPCSAPCPCSLGVVVHSASEARFWWVRGRGLVGLPALQAGDQSDTSETRGVRSRMKTPDSRPAGGALEVSHILRSGSSKRATPSAAGYLSRASGTSNRPRAVRFVSAPFRSDDGIRPHDLPGRLSRWTACRYPSGWRAMSIITCARATGSRSSSVERTAPSAASILSAR